jgi:hypothetical protein
VGLQADRHVDRAHPRGGGHLGGFAAVTPERPLAIHVLIRRKRRQNQVTVMGCGNPWPSCDSGWRR